MNKVEIGLFLGKSVRIVNDEYIVMKDIFEVLGRLDKKNQIRTEDRTKLIKLVGEENVTKFTIDCKSNKKKSRILQKVYCVKQAELEKYDLELLFSKYTQVPQSKREEIDFVTRVEDFFKYDDYISLEKQFKVMEFRVDLAIGNSVFVEFDEKHHKNQIKEDIDRMKKIALANTYRDGYLHNTNDYNDLIYTKKEYAEFTTYSFGSAFFIRIKDRYCLNWIPLVYEHYAEYMDFIDIKPTVFSGHSSELINLKYSC